MTESQPDAADDAAAPDPAAAIGLPPEDAGSDTQSRYRYQSEIAARHGFASLTHSNIRSIVCEWHEDYVVIFDDGLLELVSVKHREPGQGPWTMATICKDGGLAHLFDRWFAAGRASHARLCSNAGLSAATGNAGALQRLCGQDLATIAGAEDLVRELACRLMDASRDRGDGGFSSIPSSPENTPMADYVVADYLADAVIDFLKVLNLDCDLPHRSNVEAVNLQELVRPALRALGLSELGADASYASVVSVIEAASRDDHGTPTNLAAVLADTDRLRKDHQLNEIIRRRTVSAEMIRDALIDHHGRVMLLPSGVAAEDAPGGPDLRRKMTAGGCGEPTVRLAEMLRAAWWVTWRERKSGLVGDASLLYSLSAEVLALVESARHATTSDADAYGEAFNREISARVIAEALPSRPLFAMHPLHPRGLAYQLGDECYYDFSPLGTP
jgi:hypothetical protein